MKKINFFQTPALVAFGILFSYSVSYGGNSVAKQNSGFNEWINGPIFQDTSAKKAKPTKRAEIDRTKGEAGRGQGKGTDTIPRSADSGKRGNKAVTDQGAMDKSDQNSDNRGEGAGKNNRAGNSKKGVDTTRQ